MRGCLDDEALILFRYDEGSDADRQHLASCLPCAARYHRLDRDLTAIGGALERGRSHGGPVRGRRYGRMGLVAASVAALVVLASGEAWMWRASKSIAPPRVALDAETVAFLDEIATFLAGEGDGNAARAESEGGAFDQP